MALLILFLFALMSGNLGNGGNGGGNNMVPYILNQGTNTDVQAGFDQAAVMGQLGGISANMNTGFATAEVARANNVASILQAINGLAMGQQNCCCENRLAVANLGSDIAREACADRQAVNDGVRDLQNTITNGIQTILTQMCNDKIDAKNEKIAEQQQIINMTTIREGQTAQTAQLLAAINAINQTAARTTANAAG